MDPATSGLSLTSRTQNLQTSGEGYCFLLPAPYLHANLLPTQQRARAYLLSTKPLNTPLSGREGFGCNCYSSGEEFFTERIMIEAYTSILRYFSLVDKVPGYQELPIIIPQGKYEEDIEGEGWGAAVSWGDEVKTNADADAAGADAVTTTTSFATGAAAAAAKETSEEKKNTDTEEELVEK